MSQFAFKQLIAFSQAVAVGALQSVSRFTLWLSCHGILLPWHNWAESNVSTQTVERYKRRAMVAKLKAQRFKIARGPFFVRAIFENVYVLIRMTQFPIMLALKFSGAILVCFLPLLIFFVVRVYLPVPQRMALEQSAFNVNLADTADVLNGKILRMSDLKNLQIDEGDKSPNDGVFDFKTTDNRTGEGVLIQGRGGPHEERWRGWRLALHDELLMSFPPDPNPRMLRLKYKAIPTRGQSVECRIDVMTDVGQFIFASMFTSQPASANRLLKSPLTRRLQEKLLPELAGFQAALPSNPLIVPVAKGMPSLRFKVSPVGDGNAQACDVLLYGFEWQRKSEAIVRNSKKNFLIFLFKSMNYDFASNPDIMPWMSSLMRSSSGMMFSQHHALDIRDNHSFQGLLGLTGGHHRHDFSSDTHLIERLRSLGYRVIMIGDLGPAELQNRIMPDVAIHIANETYQARLSLKQLSMALENEVTAPAVIIVRLNGLQTPWWPVFADLDFKQLFFGGRQRGLMDTLVQAHAKSLDRELEFHIENLRKKKLFDKFDLLMTAERGFDLGLNLPSQDSLKATFTSDVLLNQDSLKVPLVYVPASPRGATDTDSQRFIQTVTTHHDLFRTLWETLGVTDVRFPIEARRLWQTAVPSQSRNRSSVFAMRDTSEQLKSFPLQSRLQEGVLFTDPDSTGGFLKYVSQSVPARMNVPDAYGWPTQRVLNLPAGEQFRQVSRRGAREEVLGRVNSRFVRESRKVIRLGRKNPLRLSMEFTNPMSVDLSFELPSEVLAKKHDTLPAGLQSVIRKVSDVSSHLRIFGQVDAGQRLELSAGLGQLRFVSNIGPALLVACPEGFVFSPEAMNVAMSQKSVCLLETPEPQRLEYLKSKGKKVISVWLVEDEKQACSYQNETEDNEEYPGCPQAGTAESEGN